MSDYRVDFERGQHLNISISSRSLIDPLGVNACLRYDGAGVKYGSSDRELRSSRDLSAAVARLTGITYGVVHLWAKLLLPNIVRGSALADWGLQRMETGANEGAPKEVSIWNAAVSGHDVSMFVRTADYCMIGHKIATSSELLGEYEFIAMEPGEKADMKIEVLGDPLMTL